MKEIELYNDHFQNYKVYGIPKAQLIIADVPYNLGNSAYASNPSWYVDGDNKNGESDKAGKQFFDTDKDFRPAEFMHFCSQMLVKEPKEKGKAPCMIIFCEFEDQFRYIELGKRYGLNNYINLYSGTTNPRTLGNIKLSSFGAGSGFLGIPGDITPPSRFIRAAFYQTSSPQKETAIEAVIQSFHILNNFDIPIGIEFSESETPTDIPSATQWTSSTDLTHRVIYYRTMYNSDIRCIDLKAIDFYRVKYQAVPLDLIKQQPIQPVRIN